MKNDCTQFVNPEVLPPETVENDVYIQRNQHGQVVKQYSITRVGDKVYRTQEQVVWQQYSQLGHWLQMVGGLTIGFIGLYLLIWAIGFMVSHSSDKNDRSHCIEVVKNA